MPQEILYSFNSDRKSQEIMSKLRLANVRKIVEVGELQTISSFQAMGDRRCALSSVSIAKALRNQTKSKE